MEQKKTHRLTKVAKDLGVGVGTLIEFFKKSENFDLTHHSKISNETYELALEKFGAEKKIREKIREQKEQETKQEKVTLSIDGKKKNKKEDIKEKEEKSLVQSKKNPVKEDKKEITADKKTEEEITKKEKSAKTYTNSPKIVGKIDLSTGKIKTKEDKDKKKEDKVEKVDKKEAKEQSNEQQTENKKEEEKILENKKEQTENITGTEPKENKKENKVNSKPTNEKKGRNRPIPKLEKRPKLDKKTSKKSSEIKDAKRIEHPEESKSNNTKEESSNRIKGPKVLGRIDLDKMNLKTRPDRKTKKEKEEEKKKKRIEKDKQKLKLKQKKDGNNTSSSPTRRRKRKRIVKVEINQNNRGGKGQKHNKSKQAGVVDEKDVSKQVRETLQKLENKKQKSKAAKFRRGKRDLHKKRTTDNIEREREENKILKVTEFITVKEISDLMNVNANQVIEICFDLGHHVTINYRLDSELINLVSDEFGFEVEFVQNSFEEEIEKILSDEENLSELRPPIVTVMGHVDHGKTSLLDYIRNTNVVSGESGGITQHIGAYSVKLKDFKKITFIDTPGHRAFTDMRARGTKVTDIVIIIIAANDSIMPQTDEAIDHAKAAGVPMIFAINKIDLPGADPEKIKQQLAERNILVEDWGGKYASVEISAKKGTGVNNLLERIAFESEMLELKANPNRNAIATVLEARLDKGRGYIANVILRTGMLHVGDIMVAGGFYGKVKALFDEFNKRNKEVGPSSAIQILGLNGAPEPGEPLVVVDSEKEARDKAEQRLQIIREMEFRARKKHSLEEISRRLAEGEKLDLNIIVKADVKGSVDAITSELVKLSNEEVNVNVIRNAVGEISDTDIMLAAASMAITIGFNVRPSASVRKLAESKNVEIRLYSIIYDLIQEVKDAVRGMLKPETKETIIGTAEVMEVFKVSKVGSIAGSIVRDGKITNSNKVRLIRDGIVVYTGNLSSLKRFKDDVKEVAKGFDCGIGIENFNDIKQGDIVESFEEFEVAREL